jgi:hypothetical protein
MKSSGLAMLLWVLFSPALSDAQEIYRATRSLEEQQAISHISQAEYYARMALRSLEASEKIGKAPYFNYQSAREDIQKVLTEFKTYLRGDESMDLPPAVPLMVDGRYFAESIKDFLATQKPEERQATGNVRGKSEKQARLGASKIEAKGVDMGRKKSFPDTERKKLQENSAITLPSPSITPQSGKTKRDKIEEILKKGL